MTREEMDQIVTVKDLHNLYLKLKSDILDLTVKNKKEFYTPKEFQEKTGLKYRTIIYYCNIGRLKALQKVNGGTWLIYHTEIDEFIKEAEQNKYNS